MPFFDPIRIGASGAADTAFTVDRSLRFDDSSNHKLTRTFATNTSDTTKTASVWVKRSHLGSQQTIFSTTVDGLIENRFEFLSTDQIQFVDRNSSSGGSNCLKITGRLFRDPSAWYHIVIAVDTTDSTAEDRYKLYINGVRETDFSGGTNTNFPQNHAVQFFRSSVDNFIGVNNGSSAFFDGYLAEINFCDGQALTPSSFAETNSTTGQWLPIDTGNLTFGTNGFTLNFSDNSSTTASTLGKDTSGNGNNFTPNNFGATSHDQLKDTPTNNFSTFSPLFYYTNGVAFSEGNLKVTFGGSGNGFIPSTFALQSGKWYAECLPEYIGNGVGIGIAGRNINVNDWSNGTDVLAVDNEGNVVTNSSNSYPSTPPSSSYTTSDIIGVALDITAGTVTFYKNNSQIYQTNLSNMSTGGNSDSIYFFCFADGSSATSGRGIYNFGQDSSFAGNKTAQGNTDGNGIGDFYYAPPSGHLAICSANLPNPTILLPNKHFDISLYSGTGSSQNITGLEYQPDWVWIKSRSTTTFHNVYDTLRLFSDGTKERIYPNGTNAGESATYSGTTNLTAFNSNGFTVGDGADTNANGQTFVAWNWNGGDTDGKTYAVTVVSDSGNKYRFDGFGTSAVTLDLAEGGTYIFNYPSAHPFRFSTTSDGTHGGGSEYTTGVTVLSSTSVQIVVAASAPTLYYYCTIHSGMGGAINTNSTLGSSNFDGTIQTTVKANTTSGLSIVKWTGNGSSGATIGHGLGVAPKSAFVKNRSSSTNWPAVLFDLQTGGQLNTSQAFSNGNYNAYFAGQPSSSVLTLGSHNSTNANGDNYVAYVFSEVSFYNKFASYTGNGNTNGTFVFTGFRPAWVVISNSNAGFDWVLQDSKRSPGNVANKKLNPNQSAVEQTAYDKIDILSNGFKPRVSDAGVNANGSVYYYWAFAESPFKNARAR